MTAGRLIAPFARGASGTAAVPGSKSITNRALLCAALAHGRSELTGALFAQDTDAMAGAAVAIGAKVTQEPTTGLVTGSFTGSFTVEGIAATPGAIEMNIDDKPRWVDARSSGTTARFMLPVLAALGGRWVLDGSAQLRKRPFGDLTSALREMGAGLVEHAQPGLLPIEVVASAGRIERGHAGSPGSRPRESRTGGNRTSRTPAPGIPAPGIPAGANPADVTHRIAVRADVSSQFASGLLLAAPILGGIDLRIEDPHAAVSVPYIDMTVAVMSAFGAQVEVPSAGHYIVWPGVYQACEYPVEPDASAASYFWAAAAVCGGSVRVEGLGSHSIQGDVRFAQILQDMGAQVDVDDTSVTVAAPAHGVPLGGGTFDMRDCSDTAQTLAAVAAFARGPSHIGGIGFIRRKETDRVADTVAELRKRGVEATALLDGFTIRPNVATMRSGTVDCHDDHRMAMSMSILALRVAGIRIDDPGCVDKSFPGFFDALEALRAAPSTGDRHGPATHVIAIDGPAASGKSSVARAVAAALGVDYLDTGAMYRAVALAALSTDVDPHDADAVAHLANVVDIDISNEPRPEGELQRVTIDGSVVTEAIRSSEVDRNVSAVAANPAVRRVLVARQRTWAQRLGGGVMEGRDIGSVVFPDADLKVFLTATPLVRATRRLAQHVGDDSDSGTDGEAIGDAVSDLAAELDRRDRLDSGRADSPLRVAAGAVVVDTSEMTFDEVVAQIIELHRTGANSATGLRGVAGVIDAHAGVVPVGGER